MKTEGGTPAPLVRRVVDFYRLQARLTWEWRPNRLAIVRRAVLSFVGACLVLAVTGALLPGLTIDGPGSLLLAGLVLASLDRCSDVVLHWLLVAWPIFMAQTVGLVVQFVAIVVLADAMPGIGVDGLMVAVWGAVLITSLNSLFAEVVSVSDDDSYYGVLVRRLVARDFGRPAEPKPGLLVVQIDGLSLPVLHQALRSGRVPVLGRLLREGEATLHPWIALLPPTTPASQAGILHGRNDGIPGFRWYEKASYRLLVANHPDDAAEIVRRISDGTGLLADDGASIGNLVTGDAPRSYLTMATIAQGASPADERSLRGLYVTTVDYIRLLVLMAGEMAKELYQAERQRARSVEPRMHRDLHFAVERAVTNVALRTVSTALVIEEMYCSAPTIYVDYTGYDAISHHCGPERQEALDALEGIDRAIGSLLKAARHTQRPYRLVVLSDHGQCLGATFQQRYGRPLEAVMASLLPGGATVVGTTDSVESAGIGRRIAAEFSRGSSLGPILAGRLRRAVGHPGLGAAAPLANVVVCSSGNLAHVYINARTDKMTAEAVEHLYPGLIDGLANHPGIGALVVRTDAGHVQVVSPRDRLDLTSGLPDGSDLAAEYGPRAAEELLRLEGFPNAGDLILMGGVHQASGQVTGFEELIGSHGGLGGWQTEPFILCPASLELAQDPLLGAPAVYRQLLAWRAQLQAEQGG